MDKLYDLKLTTAEIAAVAVGFAKTSDRLSQSGDGGDLAVKEIADAIENKARLLLEYAKAKEAEAEARSRYSHIIRYGVTSFLEHYKDAGRGEE